jgi:hypothetical protein
MKTFTSLFLSISTIILVGIACDKIDSPVIEKTSVEKLIETYYPGKPDDYELNPTFTPNTNTNRNVLLEDYTGHRCNNCPAAATIAKNIEAANPNRVFIMSVHAGPIGSTFQEVSKPGDSKYPKFS